ncbi:MAG: ribosome-associated translation inhibitor RaiA [Spirochaetes bacterium]|nr:ribosome-associated translation inhibitor RaiA [Spirochaetota bacterium]
MKLTITGRHFEVSEELSQYAEKKFTKIKKYFRRLIDIEIIMYLEKHNHIIEAVINGDGMKFFGTEKASDMYSSVDLLAKSIEKQVVKHKEKHSAHKATPLKDNIETVQIENQTPIIFNKAAERPKDEIEAFLEMKLDNKDFILFNKSINDNNKNLYAVIFKTDNGFKMAELPPKSKKEKRFDAEKLIEFDLIVHNDSLTKPKIKLKKCREKTIKCAAMNSALKDLTASNHNFIPFFNDETNTFNIIYKNGDILEVMVPPE